MVGEVDGSQANICGHLACLKDCGLIADRAQGRANSYRGDARVSGSFPATGVASGVLEPGSAQWRCQARLARWLARLALGYMAAEGGIAVAELRKRRPGLVAARPGHRARHGCACRQGKTRGWDGSGN